MLEKGANHLIALEAPVRPARPLGQRRAQVAAPPPARPRPAGRAPHVPPPRGRRRPPLRRPRELAAVDGRRRRLPRRRQAAPLPRGRLPPAIDARPGRGRRRRRLAAHLRRPRALLRRGRAPGRAWPARRPTRSPPGAPGPFPMPPGPDMQGAILSMAAAERAGLHPYRCPSGVNSVPYDGRPACNNCGFCGGFGCPIEAKGDPVALLRRALRTGRCDIRPESYVVEITTTADGRRATGVRYLDADAGRARGPRRPRRAGRRRLRDPAPAAAPAASATRRASSGATSCTTSRRSRSGPSPSGSSR